MICITGDTHGEYGRFSKHCLKENGFELADKDYMIVCGDLGLCWMRNATFKYECEKFKQKPYTVLWVQGNHENYDFISEFETEEWNGGKVRHIVRDKVILLERGQVFRIEGKTFFTFGGASSHDIQGGILDPNDPQFHQKVKQAKDADLPFRILGETWWPQELPTREEMKEGLRNLKRVGYQVDYVITHCGSDGVQKELVSENGDMFEGDILTAYFQKLEKKLKFRKWYMGHYHMDRSIDERHRILYQSVIVLE